MTRRQMFWSGLLALTLLRIILGIPFSDWRYAIFNLAALIYAYNLGRMKPAIVRIVTYPPRKIEHKELAKEIKKAIDLTPGRHR